MLIIDSIQLNYTKEEILKIFSEGHNKNKIDKNYMEEKIRGFLT